MLDINELFTLIAESLDVERDIIKETSSSESIDEWDSLGHLSILSSLDEVTNGKASEVEELAEALTIEDLTKILSKAGLLNTRS
jgi:acyl carrier protein